MKEIYERAKKLEDCSFLEIPRMNQEIFRKSLLKQNLMM